jgi:RNA 2',3'-cyclic 3'-phosphodiesterase
VRLFVAGYPPPEALVSLGRAVDALHVGRAAADGINARLAGREQWHVTLVFLGEVEDGRSEDVTAAVDRAAAGVAGHPELCLTGGGTFGRGRFTVLWAGLGGDVAALRAVSAAVSAALRKARLPFDHKPFRPHLTIARPGDRLPREAIRADVEALRGYQGPTWTLGEIALVRSHLGPHPTYDLLHTAPLCSL